MSLDAAPVGRTESRFRGRDRLISTTVGMAIFMSACQPASGPAPVVSISITTTDTAASAPAELEPAESVSSDSTFAPSRVAPTESRGVVTATGVPVIVLEEHDDNLLVRSPCGEQVTVRDGTPIGPVSVVLDPGHGGPIDTGAQGPNGLVESHVNLRLANRLADELTDRGVSVALTRTGDYSTTLPVRAAFADEIGAAMLVSIHHNAPISNTSRTPGTEVFVQSGSSASERLGGLIHQELTTALEQFDIEWHAAPDAGVLHVLLPEGDDAYGMIRRPATTAVLVEVGYIANLAEAELFETDVYIEVAAIAMADAIIANLETDRSGSGMDNPPRVFRPIRATGADVCVDPLLE